MRNGTTYTQPRVLLVGRTRYPLPLSGAETRKFSAVGKLMSWHLLARGRHRHHDQRLTLIGRFPIARLDGLVFQLRLPLAILRTIRRFRPDAIVAQDPYVAAAALLARHLSRQDVAVIAEIHGDWRTATRLYGRRSRSMLAWPADAIARTALRRVDAARAISGYTAALVIEVRGHVDALFPTFLDLEPFTSTPPTPLPNQPVALFIGALERYKNIDNVLTVWTRVHNRLPEARLRIVGTGTLSPLVEQTARRNPSIEYLGVLDRQQVAAILDKSTCLVLPSRSEGMGRVVAEAFSRGRAVLATRVGGLPELIDDGVTGLFIDLDDSAGLESALVRILSDRALALDLGTNAAARAAHMRMSPEEWAQALLTLLHAARPTVRAMHPAASSRTELVKHESELAGSVSGSGDQSR